MRRRFMNIGGDVIYYTSTNGNIIVPFRNNFGDKIISNTYNNGVGKIKFKDKITTIDTDLFFRSASLKTITIPSNVVIISSQSFEHCNNLINVTIPDSVTTIGEEAFYGCTSLTSVYCKATTPPTLGRTYVFFNNATDRKIYVPYQSLDAYKTAQYWSYYAADIVGYDFENDTVVGGNNLITFTVNNDEYQAEEGMTWEEWCNSEYNVDEFFCESNSVRIANGMPISFQTPSDVIGNGGEYSAMASGGSAD